MERLSFTDRASYRAIEAACHVVRYSVSRDLCSGRRVLDVACGEGYGSFLMATEWSAKSVLGVDISEEAISSARVNFRSKNISYEVGSAYELTKYAATEKFDLIVSIETIEHLEHPEVFLKEIKKVAAEGATIIISCPNDPMLYENDPVGNVFHLHRYTADEFFQTVSAVLGECKAKLVGTSVGGFGNFVVGSDCLDIGTDQRSMLEGKINYTDPVIQVPPEDHIDLSMASYYVGIWGDLPKNAAPDTLAFYPSDAKFSAHERLYQDLVATSSQVSSLKTQIWDLEHGKLEALLEEKSSQIQVLTNDSIVFSNEIEALQKENKKQRLDIKILNAENKLAKESVFSQREELHALKEENQVLAQELTELRGNHEASTQELTELRGDHEALQEKNKKQRLDIKILNAENKLAKESVFSQREELQALKEENQVLAQELTELRGNHEALQAENIFLVHRLEEAENKIASIPWRTVAIYRRTQRILPRKFFAISGKIFDKIKRK